MTQSLPRAHAVSAENELDIRGLFRTLWAGKGWIVGIALLFALIALAYTFFARQEWSATAISDRPTVNMLGGTTPSSSSYVIWMSKPTSRLLNRRRLWTTRTKSS